MNAEQYAAAERSALDKKLDPWGGALVGQQYYFQHQQQDPAPSQESDHHHQHYNQQLQPGQQQQPAYHATISPREDGSLFQPDAPGTGFRNAHSTIFQASANAHNAGSFTMAHNIPPQPHTTRNAPSPAPLHLNSPPTDQMRTRPLPVSMTPPPLTPIRDHRNHKGSTVVSRSSHRPERFAPDIPAGRISNLAMVKSSSPHTGRRIRSTAMSAFTVRPTGTKDRHSKVRTAKGLRDRRVRLSAPTAIQFFDVQDRLGYDQPSKAVDWLIEKARAAIDELAPIQGIIIAGESTGAIAPAPQSRDVNHSCARVKDEEQQRSIGIQVADPRAESRVKARERARERAKEKSTTTSPIPAATATAATTITTTTTNSTSALSNTIAAISSFTTTPPFPSSPPNLHLLPEFLLMTSQFCQLPPPDHDMQRPLQPQDLASILPSPASASSATHLLPFTSHFFPAQFTGSGAYFGDAPSMQISAPPILYSNMNNSNNSNIIPISPRGTLQSIFSNPTSSNAQAYTPQLPPVMMMGSLHAHAYGAAPLGSTGGCITSEARDHQQSSSHELGSPDLHQQVRIPMCIHGMKLGSQEESRITPPSSMEAEL